MEPDDEYICSKCGEECAGHYSMCDRVDGVWCPKCFPATPCGSGAHGEGCPTNVFGGE